MRSATEVEAVRILPASFPGLGEGLLGGWTAPQTRGAPPEFGRREGDAVLGPVVFVAPDDVATLTTVLTATGTFGFRDDGGGSACLFDPGVLVRFWCVDEPVDVLICFRCVELAAFRSGRRLCWLTSFGPGYRAVLDAVRRVFPDDEALRALAERRQ